jgi:hypothetical protein
MPVHFHQQCLCTKVQTRYVDLGCEWSPEGCGFFRQQTSSSGQPSLFLRTISWNFSHNLKHLKLHNTASRIAEIFTIRSSFQKLLASYLCNPSSYPKIHFIPSTVTPLSKTVLNLSIGTTRWKKKAFCSSQWGFSWALLSLKLITSIKFCICSFI